MEKKKIAIIQPLIPRIGGNEKVFSNIIEALKDHDLTVYTFSKPTKKYNVKIISKIPIKLPMLGMYQKFLFPKINFKNYDFIMSNFKPIKTEKPHIVYDQNNLGVELLGQTSLKYQKGFWKIYAIPYRYIAKKQIDLCKKNNCYSISKYSAEILGDVLKKQIKVLYPPINFSEFQHKEKLNQICVVGRLSPEKNLDATIDILNEIEKPCYVFGSANPTHLKYILNLQHKAKSHIKFMINQPRKDLIELLATSKVIFSMSKETLGIAILEGIASRCVPIVPDNTGNKETVPFQRLRVTPTDKESIIKKLNLALDGEYDGYLPELLNHIKLFDYKHFKNTLNSIFNEA